MGGFTKLWGEITSSSIWNEDDKTRIVWITMLAMMDPDFVVRASIGGLAHQARVSREDCEMALEKLRSADPDSRSKEYDGARIQDVPGGFYLINGQKFREARSDDDRRKYMREYMKEYRKKCKPPVNNVSKSKTGLAQAEAEKEKNPPNPPRGEWTPSSIQLRLNALYGRRDTTKWSAKMIRAFRAIDFDEAEIVLVETAHKDTSFWKRKSLGVLLNNWTDEVDKARNRDEPTPRKQHDKPGQVHRGTETREKRRMYR